MPRHSRSPYAPPRIITWVGSLPIRGATAASKGLWACGEVACTGLHGANRLASNSLLEAVWSGRQVAEDIAGSVTTFSGHFSSEAFGEGKSRRNPALRQTIRDIMSSHVGVLRDREGLQSAVTQLTPLATQSDVALAGLLIATSALRREESRGAHTRLDFPAVSAYSAQRSTITLDDLKPAELSLRHVSGI